MTRLALVLALLCLVRHALAEDDARVDALIRQLGSDDWTEREAASDALRRLLEKDREAVVEAPIEAAREDRDPEIAGRCADLLDSSPWRNIVVERGSWDRLEARDALHNRALWTYAREGTFWTDPTTRLRRLYVSPSAGGLECLELRSGEVLWRIDPTWTEDLHGNGRWYGHHEDQLTCVDLRSGRILWTHSLRDLVYPTHRPYLAADEEVAVVRTWSGLCALDTATGAVLWTRKDPDLARVWMLRGRLYSVSGNATGGTSVCRLEARSGEVVWGSHLDASTPPTSLTEAKEGELIFWAGRAGDQAGLIGALETETGRVLWSHPAPDDEFQPAGDGEHGWLGASGELLLVRLDTGEVEREWHASSQDQGKLAWRVGRGLAVIVRCDSPFKSLVVEGCDSATGRTLWEDHEAVPPDVTIGGGRFRPFAPRCDELEIREAGDLEMIAIATWVGSGFLLLDRRTGRVVRRMARLR